MKKRSSINNDRKYLLIYTTLFVLLFYACFEIWFQKYEKTYFRSFDGLDQHYLIFVYIGKWMRQIVKGILLNHKLIIPMWNMGIGYGADIITSTGAYLPDPFNWLSIVIPTRYSEAGYAAIIILKIYLSGLSFSLFCYHRKIDDFSTLIGSLIYTFSGTMYIIFVESFFANPMYIFPLVLIGADNLWKNKGSKLYVFSLAFMFMNYFYFAYMTVLLLVGYCLVRLYFERRNYTLKNTIDLVIRFIYNSFFSAGIAMIVLLPIMIVLVQAERLGVKYYNPILYSKQYYIDFVSRFFSVLNMSHRDAYIGFGMISFFCIIILFIKRKSPMLRTIFIILTIGLCIPSFGILMNGLSYYANRWCWAYAFCVAYIVSTTIPDLLQLKKSEKRKLAVCSIAYIALVMTALQGKTEGFISLSGLLMISILVIYILPLRRAFFSKWAIITLTVISIIVPAYYQFNQSKGNFLKDWTDNNTAYRQISTSGGLNYLEDLSINQAERYETGGVPYVRNASWIYGISGMDFYISIYNNNIDRFHNDIAMPTSPWTNGYRGLNGRSELEYLMNVKYFVTDKNNKMRPYLYKQTPILLTGSNMAIYETNINNSLVHGFNHVIEKEDVDNLEPYYKQKLLMQAPFVESINENDSFSSIATTSDEINVNSIQYSDNLRLKDNRVEAVEEDGTITISFDDVSNAELYIYLKNVDYHRDEENSYNITARLLSNGNEISNKSLSLLNNKSHMYGGKHNWLVNMGIVDSGANQVVLEFNTIGHYTLDDICIYAKPVSEIKRNIDKVPSIASDVTVENNAIRYDIIDDSFRYMMISVPYSSGWTAYVDGEKRDIRICDDAFMLINLKNGDKHVEIKYLTPGLLPGMIITILTLCLYCYIERRRQHRDRPYKERIHEIHQAVSH